MNDVHWLALILAGVYLVECVVRVPTGGLALRTGRGGALFVRPAEWSDVLRGGVVLDEPLPLLHGHAVLQPWTLSLSPDGFAAPDDGRDGRERRFVRWDEEDDFTTDGLDLFVGATPFARLASPEAAERVATALTALAASRPAAREKAIVAAVDARLDAAAVAVRREAWSSAVERVRVSANVLFFAVVAFVVGISGVPGFDAVWPFFLAAVALALIWTLVDFSFAHRRLYPGADVRRRRALFGMAISPLGAIRAAAVAGRDVFAAWDPLAVASVMCDEPGFRDFARRTLSELLHPRRESSVRADEPAARCEVWFRSRLVERFERFLRGRGVDPHALLEPPSRSDETVRSYCPRCRAQYEIAPGACADCGGVALVEFGPAPPAL